MGIVSILAKPGNKDHQHSFRLHHPLIVIWKTHLLLVSFFFNGFAGWVWHVGGVRKESGFSNIRVGFKPWPLTSSRKETAQLSKNQQPSGGRGQLSEEWCKCCLQKITAQTSTEIKRFLKNRYCATDLYFSLLYSSVFEGITGIKCVRWKTNEQSFRYEQGVKKKVFFPRMLTEKNKTASAGKAVIEEVTRIKAV